MFGSKPSDGSVFVPGRGEGEATTTLIARGVKVEGEFTSQGDVAIEGEVHGTLSCTGLLTVGSEAKIRADVRANDAVIAGVVEGNVVIAKRFELKASARVMGDVTCEIILIEAGACVVGKMTAGRKATDAHPVAAGKRERSGVTASATS